MPPEGWVPVSAARPAPIPDAEVLPRVCCDVCGVMVGDVVAHDAWHARVEQLERTVQPAAPGAADPPV